jgi:NADPH2:quinone reductase
MIKRKGTIVAVGDASGPVEPFSLLRLLEKNVKLIRPTSVVPLFCHSHPYIRVVVVRMTNYIYTPEEAFYYIQQVWKMIGSGDFKMNIFKEYPFTAEGVKQAQQDLTEGKTMGKLLIKIAN